jgi:transcriptional regulator with XRE-family HTH domain
MTKRAVRDLEHRDDPLCPIRGDRVRAALNRSGWSVSELARKVGAKQPGIDLIVRGKTKRCRRSLLRRIAKVLGASVSVLDGSPDGTPWPSVFDDLHATPIAFRVFFRAVQRSAWRDKMSVYSNGFPPGLEELVDPAYWRRQLLSARPKELQKILALEDLSLVEQDRLGAMMADVMLLALKPWFEGRATLKTLL